MAFGSSDTTRSTSSVNTQLKWSCIMTIMKSVTVTEFKTHCLELIDQAMKNGKSFLLTKRGEPAAMLNPPPKKQPRKWIPGQFRDEVKVVGDIVSPLDVEWE